MKRLNLWRQAVCCLLSALLMTSVGVAAEGDAAGKADAAKAWAHISLSGSFAEGAEMPGLFGATSETLAAAIDRLNRVANDEEISGVMLRVGPSSLGWAKLNELRIAVKQVRDSGRKVIAVVDDASTQQYLIASACDEIVMPESGSLMMLGVRAEVTFYRNLFDMIGVQADMMQVGEFKGAAEPYTRSGMSPEMRQDMESLIDDYFELIVETIAADRKLTPEAVKAAIDTGPHTAGAAKKLGLIDQLAYDDEVRDRITGELGASKIVEKYGKKKIDTDFSGLAGMMKMMNLMMGVEPRGRASGKAKIAVVYASGIIMTGRSMSDMLGGEVLGSETLVSAIEKAAADEDVKAIVLRIDSPGGSALASDLIWRALKKCDKPVVASMGNTAASGGYYIAAGTDAIFAEPGTLTGSIGVVGGKLAIGGAFEKIGLTTTVISRGQNSGALSTSSGFSETERAAMRKLMEDIYDQFTGKVADARPLSLEEVQKLARGRVYTGRQAKDVKLVDELGTLDDAIQHAKKLAGIAPGIEVDRLVLPKATSPFEALFGPIDGDVTFNVPGVFQQALEVLPTDIARELSAAAVLKLLADEKRLTVMPYRIRVE